MVSCNHHDPDMGDCGKEIIDFFDIPHQRLAVKKIAADKQAVGFHCACMIDNGFKRIPDGLCPFFSPGFICIRGHAPMYIACMDEFHNTSPSSGSRGCFQRFHKHQGLLLQQALV